MPILPSLGVSVALFLLAAKTHGRQLRIERELEGYMEVDFRKENPPWVEALWRADRIRFWSLAPLLALVLAGAALVGYRPSGQGPDWGWALVEGLLWAPSLAFLFNGVWSLVRFEAALQKPAGAEPRRHAVRRERGPWLLRAQLGTLGYWAGTLALAAAAGLLAWS